MYIKKPIKNVLLNWKKTPCIFRYFFKVSKYTNMYLQMLTSLLKRIYGVSGFFGGGG